MGEGTVAFTFFQSSAWVTLLNKRVMFSITSTKSDFVHVEWKWFFDLPKLIEWW